MTIALWFSLVVSANGATCVLKPVDNIVTVDREIRIEDVVELDCIPERERERIGQLTIAVLPVGEQKAQLERSAVKALVRRRVPRLDLPFEPRDREQISLMGPDVPKEPAARTCKQARRAIPSGKIVVTGDLESAACRPASDSAGRLSFDRVYQVVRTTRDIAPGDFLGRLDAPPTAFDMSEPVSISVRIGSVQIRRDGEAAQPGIGGREVFVRDSEGAIFAVPTLSETGGTE